MRQELEATFECLERAGRTINIEHGKAKVDNNEPTISKECFVASAIERVWNARLDLV